MAESSLSENHVKELADHLYNEHQQEIYRQTDTMFAWFLLSQWIFEIALALIVSPRAWYGSMSRVHVHVWTAIIVGGIINIFPIFLGMKAKGHVLTRYTIAVAQMSNSALLVHLTGGRIETHFHVFGSLAIVAFYRDWRVLIPATLVVLIDHVLRGIYWPQSVYGVLYASIWRSLEHAGWVIFEDIFLIMAAFKSKREMYEIAEKRARLEVVNHQIEKIVQERTAKLQENEARLRAMNDASPFGLFVTSPDGECSYANQAYERFSSLSQKQILGKGWVEAIHPEDRERVVREWNEAVKSSPFVYESIYRFCGAGNIFWVKVKAVPMISGERLMGYVGIADDITDQKTSEKHEVKLLDEAKKLTEIAQKKTQEIERFQQMAVGRELEMIKLKGEVNELLRKLNMPDKYRAPNQSSKALGVKVNGDSQ